MARIRMMSGIASISGRMGNYCFRTMKATGKVYMHPVAAEDERKKGERVSEAVKAQRERFATIAQMVRAMYKSGSKLTRKQLWKKAAEVYESHAQV